MSWCDMMIATGISVVVFPVKMDRGRVVAAPDPKRG